MSIVATVAHLSYCRALVRRMFVPDAVLIVLPRETLHLDAITFTVIYYVKRRLAPMHRLTRLQIKQVLSSSGLADRDTRPFGDNRHGLKIGGLCPFWEGELGAHVTRGLGQSLPSYQMHRSNQRFCHNKHGPKIEGCGGELGPHVAQCGLGRGLPPYQVAS